MKVDMWQFKNFEDEYFEFFNVRWEQYSFVDFVSDPVILNTHEQLNKHT